MTMPRTPSDQYWERRSALRTAALERDTMPFLQQSADLYDQAAGQIRADIDRIVGNFAKNSDLTRDEALKILNEPLPEAERLRLLEEAQGIADLRERAKAMARVNAPAYKARIDRLGGVREAAAIRLGQVSRQQISILDMSLGKTAREGFNRTVFEIQRGTGLGYSFEQVSQRQVDEVLKQNWSGRHYSQRVWDNQEVIADRVQETLRRNMTTGRSWRRSLDEVSDQVKSGGAYSAQRLLQTESAYVANEMEAEAYQDADIEKYRFVATLDGRTSEVCQAHDGKEYAVKDRKPGVNYPPLHAHCRSTTVPVIDGFSLEGLERRARDPETGKDMLVPADMTYKEWKDSLATEMNPDTMQVKEKQSRGRTHARTDPDRSGQTSSANAGGFPSDAPTRGEEGAVIHFGGPVPRTDQQSGAARPEPLAPRNTPVSRERNSGDLLSYKTPTPQEFRDSMNAAMREHPHRAFVEIKDVEELVGSQLHMHVDGLSGICVKPDGDVVSVYNASPRRGELNRLMPWAIEHGGVKLDNFNSDLSSMYQKYGFVPVSRCSFVDEFAPDGWNYERDGRPDIVFMIHNGDTAEEVIRKRNEGLFDFVDPSTVPLMPDYDTAMDLRDKLLAARRKQNT